MNKKNLVLSLLMTVPLFLVGMENQEKTTICGIPKKIFGDEDCYRGREITACGGLATCGLISFQKAISGFSFWLAGDPCKDVCRCMCIGPAPLNECCDSRFNCCCNSCALGSTVLTGIGLTVALCAFNPCCNEKGLNKKLLCCQNEFPHERMNMDDNL